MNPGPGRVFKNSSIIPNVSYKSLLTLFDNLNPKFSADLSDTVLKIDTDNNDYAHIDALIKLEIASKFKAIIFEHNDDSRISVDEISNKVDQAGLYIASKGSNDLLLLPLNQ